EIHHHVDLAVLQQFLGGLRSNAELVRPQLCCLWADIGHRTDFKPFEQGGKSEVGSRDIAGTHDADAVGLCHLAYFHLLAVAIDRVAKRTGSVGLSCSATKY